jgi:bla regulator protein BlaR1
MSEHFLSSPFLYSLALTLIHFIWQGALVALTLKFVLLFIDNNKPQLRYGLSSLAMLCNLVLPIVTFFVIYQPDQLVLLGHIETFGTQQTLPSTAHISSAIWSQELASYLPYLSIFWLAIVSLLASKLFVEIYAVNQLSRQAAKPAIGALEARFNYLVSTLFITSSPRLFISLKVNVPMAIGWLKPVVIIPAAMISGLSPAQLDMLILHELAHIRRHDYFVNFVQTLIETFLFFHPCVLWVSNQMRNEREYCSDDIAVQHCGNPIAYAHTLADVASLNRHICKNRKYSIPNLAMAASGGDLKQRVIRLVDQQNCSSNNDAGKWLASVVIILSVMMVSLKQFVVFPIIDISAGTLTLYNATKDLKSTQYLGVMTELSETSVAKQLLSQSIKNKSKTSFSIAEKETVMIKIAAELIEESPFKAFPDSVKEYAFTPNKVAVTLPLEESVPFTVGIKTLESNVIENTLTTLTESMPKKSISALAFERTDSESNNTTKANPYFEEVKALAKPIERFNDVRLNIERLQKVDVTEISSSKNAEKEQILIENRPAKLIRTFEPKYPVTAKRKGIEIDVMVHFTISTTGRIMDLQFESKSKVSYFRSAIRNAMDKWRFTPAEVNGKAVESEMSKVFLFNLKQ